jgi:hypothetical protein
VRRAAFVVVLSLLLIGPAAAAQYDKPGPVATHADTRQDLQDIDVAAAARAAAKAAEPTVAADAEGLTRDWTCAPSTTDVAGLNAALPQIHVVYAYATGQPNHFASWADRLQGDVSVVQRFLSAQSGGTKALRFDMGTGCSTEEVDITTVQLPQPRTYYLDDFDRVRLDTWAYFNARGGFAGPRDLMILADNLTLATNYWVGLGQIYSDDRAGSGNFNNTGGVASVLWATVSSPADDGGVAHETWWPEGFLHEITHNLGGVQESSGHATLYGHCWDEADVMCYDDGSGIAMQSYCPQGSGAIDESYDCGKDDYFAPAPPAGSYLATHWNVYDSAFMASCAALAPACGGAGGPTPTPPVNSIAPAIAGTPQVGLELAALKGTWVNAPTRFGYRWERETALGWSAIAGAATALYVPTAADVGLRLRVVVTATNSDGSVVAASPPSASVAGGPAPAPTPSPAPRVTSASAWLTVTAGSPRGRRLGRVAFSAPGAGAVKTRSLRIARPTGRYAAELCASPIGGAVPTCTVKRLRARAGRLTLPALTARVGAGQRVRVTLTVRSLTRRAIAATRGSALLDV